MATKLSPKAPSSIVEKISILTFALLGLAAILNHSMWRDELNVWMVARDSHSLSELYTNVIPEGHPILWYILLYIVKYIVNAPVAMQLLHWTLGNIVVLLLWRFSPFSTLEKVLFTFGYFPFYEYYVISRNYTLVLLLSFIFCAIYNLRGKTYIPIAICLGLLANSHAFALFITLSLVIMLVVEWFWEKEQRKQYKKHGWQIDLIVSLAIATALVGFAFHTLSMAGGSVSVNFFTFDPRQALRVLGRILGGYTLLIPNSRRWLDLLICSGLALAFVTSSILFLRRSRSALIFYLTSSLFLSGFNYYAYMGEGSRHYGFYYIILIVAIWLANPAKINTSKTKKKIFYFIPNFYPKVFHLILIVQLIAGLSLFTSHLFLPFSASKATAQYIQEKKLENEFIIGSPDVVMAPISGYLDKAIYYPEIEGLGTFTKWLTRKNVSFNEVFIQAQNLLLNGYEDTTREKLLLLVNQSLEDAVRVEQEQQLGINLEFIFKFEKSWHSSERYYLYWVTLKTD